MLILRERDLSYYKGTPHTYNISSHIKGLPCIRNEGSPPMSKGSLIPFGTFQTGA